MATSDTTATKTAESGSDQPTSGAAPSNGKGTRRKLNDQQEREVTRLYAQTETPVSEISKRFGIGESSVYRVAQRHGAALRGRTATATKSTSRAAAKAPSAKTAAGGRGTRGGRGRAAGASSAKTATKTAAKSAAKSAGSGASPTGNGRRTGARAARGTATPARRTGRTAAKRGTRAGRVAGVVGRREFRVSYVAVRTFVAANMAEAIRQAEAAGATDITGIERRA